MGEKLWRLFEILNMMKGHSAGYSSDSVRQNCIFVQIDDKVYKMTLDELDENELTSEVMDKYLK